MTYPQSNGECGVQTLLSPVSLEYRIYSNSTVLAYSPYKQWKRYVAPFSRPGFFKRGWWGNALYLANCLVFIRQVKKSKIRNDFM